MAPQLILAEDTQMTSLELLHEHVHVSSTLTYCTSQKIAESTINNNATIVPLGTV